MTDWFVELIKALWLLLPAYFANAAPVIARGRSTVDFGKNWIDKKRIFGDSKTIEGFVVGVLAGFFAGAVQLLLVQPQLAGYFDFGAQIPEMSLFLAFMISIGALVGDLAGSFIKRRFDLPPGTDAPVLDQLNFIFGAAFFAMWFVPITIEMFFLMLITTPVVHRLANIIAYKMKAKKVPW